MKYLNSILTSLLFPLSYFINFKRIFLAFLLSFVMTPIILQAGDTTCSTGDVDHNITLGEQTIPGTTVNRSISYEQLYIPADGNITITMTKTFQATTFYIGTDCGLKNIYDSNAGTGTADTKSNLHEVSLFPVVQGQILYLMYGDDDSKEYTLDINFTAPIIEVSISPETITIPQGISSADLDVTLNRGPINGDLNITYTNSYDNSTNYLIIEKWYDQETITIDINTSDITQGDEFNITLISAVDSSGTDTGVITNNNTSTIKIGPPMADLSIFKGVSDSFVKINTSFYYNIAVSNFGTADASDITVTDTLPEALEGAGIIDLATTNNASPGWTCTQSPSDYSQVVCDYDGNISAGSTNIIILYATVPNNLNLIGTITNQVSVDSAADYDIRNDKDTVTTRIVAEGYDEINEVLELCYTDTTEETMLDNVAFNQNCEKTGNFWSGNGCIATVDINTTTTLTHELDITLTKMYAPGIVNGECDITVSGAEVGSCSGLQDISIDESPSYTKGYEYTITSSDGNFTIEDSNSYDGNPKNPADLDGIGIYATYTYQGVFHFGRLSDCSGNSEGGLQVTSTVDIIDTPIDQSDIMAGYYNTTVNYTNEGNNIRYIQTMVSAGTRNITGVHLDIDTLQTTKYIAPNDPKTNQPVDIDYVVIPKLVRNVEGNCGTVESLILDTNGDPFVIRIPPGSYSRTSTMVVPTGIKFPDSNSLEYRMPQDARLRLTRIDPLTLSPEGLSCMSNSSKTGNIAGLGQCANSEVQYIDAFAVDSWDRCGLSNGRPCLTSHGGYSGGGDSNYPGYNPDYDNELGCYMCTFDIVPSCSSDNFAIRPDRFDLNMSHADAPNLLRAGKGYGISLTAKNADTIISDTYSIVNDNFNDDLDTYTIKYFKDNTEDITDILNGTSDLNRSTVGYMFKGLSSTSDSTQPASAEEIVDVSYTDVGLIDLFIYDPEWAEVDEKDTPTDCNSSTHTWICGDMNVTFIPHHFTVNNIHLRNHRDGNFTYLSNDLNMSAHLDVNISAMNADDVITQNFKQGSLYYENPVSVDINITEWLGVASRHLKGNSTHKHDIPTETLLGFGGSDENGTHNIPWDESNLTQQLMFNYTRENDQTVNPFNVNGTDINVTIQSTYTDVPTPSSPAVIAGSGIADRNATFYFGRAKSSKFFYDNISASSVNTPISIVVYCDTFPTCTELTDNIQMFGKINEPSWWLSLGHVETTGDGNITLQVGTITPSGGASITPDTDVTVLVQAIDTDVNVQKDSGPLPMTVEINLDTTPTTDTNSWLIYNSESPTLNPDPFYKVRFIGESGWAGHGKTGHVVDSNASKEINKRLSW